MKQIAERVRGFFASRSTPTVERAQHTREHRANIVLTLQQDVRRLQQEITDLSRTDEQGAVATTPPPATERLTSLQRQLEQKQAELAKYQARV